MLCGINGFDIKKDTEDHKKRRGNLPKTATNLLKKWLMDHLYHPYPTEDEKGILSHQTSLSMNQISNWYARSNAIYIFLTLIKVY